MGEGAGSGIPALRPQVIGIGPLLPPIRAELEISHGVAGLLATIPVLCGVARDVTGDFAASLWLLLGLAAALVVSCGSLSPARLRRGIRRATA